MSIVEKTANRLIHEKSPYLLQHAYNPVDWYPWGDEAFKKAQAEDKPVFLSVGYSTCHWCHVMENESFEDEQVARVLREGFIAVKVDKEERPDIDAVYMEVTQTLTGGGGWPMTVIMTPDQKPFFAGTYFPKTSGYGRHGIIDILREVNSRWKADRDGLESIGDALISRLSVSHEFENIEPTNALMRQAYKYFDKAFDERDGGFGRAPKFPSPHNLMFLLRYGIHENVPRAIAMAEKTLEQMFRGGMYDHIGGGFSRYSVDARWEIPHFEKMLYDNALLTITYLEAYQLTGRELYRHVAENTLAYITREMTGPDGEFYSAQDADSDGREGLYYVWKPEEIRQILGSNDGTYWSGWYGMTKHGNFEGDNIPTLLNNLNYADVNTRIRQLNEKLLAYRSTRVKLHKDDKALTSWNSMMIAAFATAYTTLGKPEYLQSAKNAELFVRQKLTDSAGNLRVSYRDGVAQGSGFLDDYAYFTWALLTLFDASGEAPYLESAIAHAEAMTRLFADEKGGGFYMYSHNAESLITRPKETYDGAVPSGNSVAAFNLRKLAAITGSREWEDVSLRQLEFMAAQTGGFPASHSFSNIAMMTALYPQINLICAVSSADDIEQLRDSRARKFLPELTTVLITPENSKSLRRIIPPAADYTQIEREPTFYLCRDNTCSMPFTGFANLEEAFEQM
ncbi:MAG: thioredoxin domain-containing protein [Oscillospiraceae bacterium]|nr:thioredoxin domain-containing protein [Oscillospiraceae bacterium]